MIKIYGKPNCSKCVMAKNLCDSKSVEYQYLEVGKDIDVDSLKAMCPVEVRSVPQIFEDDCYIGGFEELKEELL